MMDETEFIVSDTNNGLRERLDKEINAFNAAMTGYTDGGLLCIAVRDNAGDLRAGCSGGRGAGVATLTCSGSDRTRAVLAWAPSSWPPPRKRSPVAAAARWP
jgi:hypothetical protein